MLQTLRPVFAANFTRNLHSTAPIQAWNKGFPEPKKWLEYNKVIYPPQQHHEECRPAFVCHVKPNIKYSPFKMWYVACMVRGMSVDEAIKQLKFVQKKGAQFVMEALVEAKQMAVDEHNVEFASNLWVAESFTTKGVVIKGIRRHARARAGRVEYMHCHYFVRLEEGSPPEHYYPQWTLQEAYQKWLEQMRKRRIISSL